MVPPTIPGAQCLPPGAPPMGAPMGAPPLGVPPMGAPMGAPPVGGAIPPVAPPPSDVPPAAGDEADEDINLDELLESLKEEVEEEGKKEEEEGKKLDEDKKLASSGIATSDNKKPSASASSTSAIESGGSKKDGYPAGDAKQTAADPTEASRPNQGKNVTSTNLSTPSLGGSSGPALKAARPNSDGTIGDTHKLNEENASLKKKLSDAYETITYVKGQLNEINLLNAKLLYTNKLFKEYNMNNEQKMRIVEMFDLSKNVREVKLTYANIAESLNFSGTDMKRKTAQAASSANVQSITEGLASKPVGGTKPAAGIITEGKSSQMVAHFQKLAGIKLPAKK